MYSDACHCYTFRDYCACYERAGEVTKFQAIYVT